MILCIGILLGDPPDIDEGSFVSRPYNVTKGSKRVKIGSPVYVHVGFDVIIDCNIVNGTLPITIQWFHNGSHYPTRGNISNTITITNASNGDVFECRADNDIGFDTESTTINVMQGKWIMLICMYARLYAWMLIYVVKPINTTHTRCWR